MEKKQAVQKFTSIIDQISKDKQQKQLVEN